MNKEVLHHDSSRARVGKTAFLVAGLRGMESLKKEEDRLIYDELAIKILKEENIEDEFARIGEVSEEKREMMVYGGAVRIAVRTRKIDDEIIAAFDSGIYQVVVIGAGLDFRPWRIQQYYKTDEEKYGKVGGTKWFEVDFQELFDYKLKFIGEETMAKCLLDYHHIVANACVDSWEQALFEKGFDKNIKTVWLLEGFIAYLTEEEVTKVFTSITSLSAAGSRLIASFIGPNNSSSLPMHRFKTNEPAAFLAKWGWEGIQHNFNDLLVLYNRPSNYWEDYYLVTSTFVPQI